jgi:hypothetical protein
MEYIENVKGLRALMEYEIVSIAWGIEENQLDIGGSSFVVFRSFSKKPKGRCVPPVEEVSFESAEPRTRSTTGQHLGRFPIGVQERR